jgi:hypothetical protein
MNMPGFAAEASLYKTSVRYAGKCYFGHHSKNYTAISPQACGGFKWLVCNPAMAACTACAALAPSIPLVLGCYAACLGAAYLYCRDCLDLIDVPANGGGGAGGDPSCCPPGKTCRCGGRCVSGLCLGGTCLGPGEACPPIPPRPIGCDPGEKCCERDEAGNCTLRKKRWAMPGFTAGASLYMRVPNVLRRRQGIEG